jgi:hypothetical protein
MVGIKRVASGKAYQRSQIVQNKKFEVVFHICCTIHDYQRDVTTRKEGLPSICDLDKNRIVVYLCLDLRYQ